MFCTSYPETTRLSLEEIDWLFVKEGNKGIKQFYSRAGPVKESLKPLAEIERDLERDGDGEGEKGDGTGATGVAKGAHVEHDTDEKSDSEKRSQ